MIAEYAQVGRQQLVCAMQTQVGVDDRELAVAALPLVGAWLPALLALSASSPYFDGEDTGYASYRTMVWSRGRRPGRRCRSARPPSTTRSSTGSSRPGRCRTPAMVYFDVRPSARYPTLEVRVCDAVPLLDDALTLAGLSRALVLTALRSAAGAGPAFTPPRPELVRAARWRAARSGLADVLVDPRGAAARPAREVVHALLDARPAGAGRARRPGDRRPPASRRSCAAARRPTGSARSATPLPPSTTSSRRPAPNSRAAERAAERAPDSARAGDRSPALALPLSLRARSLTAAARRHDPGPRHCGPGPSRALEDRSGCRGRRTLSVPGGPSGVPNG